MKGIHVIIASVTAIVMAIIGVLQFFFGTGIFMDDKITDDVDAGKSLSNPTEEQHMVENYEEPQSGYKSFDVYKGSSFIQDGKIYTYSGSYTDISNDSNVTNTYFKYYYKPQN